jgi:hypothetical protein
MVRGATVTDGGVRVRIALGKAYLHMNGASAVRAVGSKESE